MKIGIVGYGMVGKAQEYLAKELGHEVLVTDITFSSDIDKDVSECDIVFICTPERFIDEVISHHIENDKGLLVIKSTVPIGTTKELMEKYKIHICHNPEFLREASWKVDVLRPNFIVIGQCCDKHGTLLLDFYKSLNVDISRFITDPTTSEIVKLTLNAYLSTLLMFWKSIKQLCDKFDVDADSVAEIIAEDNRVSYYGYQPITNKIGGRCLPKDLEHLVSAYNNIEPILFNAIKKVSDVHTI